MLWNCGQRQWGSKSIPYQLLLDVSTIGSVFKRPSGSFGHSDRVKSFFSECHVSRVVIGGRWLQKHWKMCARKVEAYALKHFRDCVSDVSRNIHLYLSRVIHSFIHSKGRKCLQGKLRRYQQVWWGWQRMLQLRLMLFNVLHILLLLESPSLLAPSLHDLLSTGTPI